MTDRVVFNVDAFDANYDLIREVKPIKLFLVRFERIMMSKITHHAALPVDAARTKGCLASNFISQSIGQGWILPCTALFLSMLVNPFSVYGFSSHVMGHLPMCAYSLLIWVVSLIGPRSQPRTHEKKRKKNRFKNVGETIN